MDPKFPHPPSYSESHRCEVLATLSKISQIESLPLHSLEAEVQQLQSMGFPREQIEAALAQSGGNLQIATDMILGAQIQKQGHREGDEREIEKAMLRLLQSPQNAELSMSIYLELPKVKKIDQGWSPARLQEAMTLYGLQTNEGAASLFRDVMTGTLTIEKLCRDSSERAFKDEPDSLSSGGVARAQSAKSSCVACFGEFSCSMLYSRICEVKPASSAHGQFSPQGGAAAGAPRTCQVCYPCLFDGLHSQFIGNMLPLCVACNTPLHQNAFNEVLSILEANFPTNLGSEPHKNIHECTCGHLLPSMWKGFAAQNPESIKKHSKECSFAVIKRMRGQADELLMQSALSGGEFFVACPGANCKSWVEIAVMPHPYTGKPIKVRECVRCLSCSTTFCPKCGTSPYHYNTDCETISALRADYSEWMSRGRQVCLKELAELDSSFKKQLQDYEADKARIEEEKRQLAAVAQQAAADEAYKAQNCKNCPNCHRIVMHTGGCDSMKCGEDYHGGNKQMGCGHSFSWQRAPAYIAQDVQARRIEFNRERPQELLYRWKLLDGPEGQDLICDACAGPIVGPKLTCINCQSLTICASCEFLGPQALLSRLNPKFFGAHKAGHIFRLEMPPRM